jgi:hypothetical protein
VVGPGVCIFNELLCDADVAVLLWTARLERVS